MSVTETKKFRYIEETSATIFSVMEKALIGEIFFTSDGIKLKPRR